MGLGRLGWLVGVVGVVVRCGGWWRGGEDVERGEGGNGMDLDWGRAWGFCGMRRRDYLHSLSLSFSLLLSYLSGVTYDLLISP